MVQLGQHYFYCQAKSCTHSFSFWEGRNICIRLSLHREAKVPMKTMNDLLTEFSSKNAEQWRQMCCTNLFIPPGPSWFHFALFPEVDKTLEFESKIRVRAVCHHFHMDPSFTAWKSQLVGKQARNTMRTDYFSDCWVCLFNLPGENVGSRSHTLHLDSLPGNPREEILNYSFLLTVLGSWVLEAFSVWCSPSWSQQYFYKELKGFPYRGPGRWD